MIKTKRVYEEPDPADGFRILVDGLWPRGLAKYKAKVDLWLREIYPSDNLMILFSHDPKIWNAFRSIYTEELGRKTDLLREIKRIEREKKIVTLLYSTKDERHNNVVVLAEVLGN